MRSSAMAAGTAVIWCLLLGWYLAAGDNASRFLFFAFSTAAVYALLVLLFSLRGAEVRRQPVRSRLVEGEDLEVLVEVRIRSWFPAAWMTVSDSWMNEAANRKEFHHKLIFPWFRRRFAYRYRIRGMARGSYRFTEVRLRAGDIFGMALRSRRLKREQRVVVYPRAREIRAHRGIPGIEEGTTASRRLPVSDPRMTGVRDYVPGDPTRRIHWKLSARTGALKTRVGESAGRPDFFIYLSNPPAAEPAGGRKESIRRGDPEGGSAASFESCVRLAAGLLQYAERENLGFGLLCAGPPDVRLPFAGHASCAPGLELLANVSGTGTGGAPELLRHELLSLSPRVRLIWISARIDQTVKRQIAALKAEGRTVQLILAASREQLGPSGLADAAELERLGCPVIFAGQEEEFSGQGGAEDVGA